MNSSTPPAQPIHVIWKGAFLDGTLTLVEHPACPHSVVFFMEFEEGEMHGTARVRQSPYENVRVEDVLAAVEKIYLDEMVERRDELIATGEIKVQ